MGGATRGASALAALLLACSACSASVDGSGTAGAETGAGPSASSSADFPSDSPGGGSSTGGSSTDGSSTDGSSTDSTSSPVASSTPTYQVVTVRGTSSGRTISVRVYARDRISDCAAHAYGTAMIRFLGAHRCRGATRLLGSTVVDGRTAVLSVVSTSFAGTAADPYGPAGQFTKLEKADGTGSINDLLREGHTIPGLASRIPAHEVFQVLAQDTSVVVFDAWYATGGTDDGDRPLKRLQTDLFVTPLTAN